MAAINNTNANNPNREEVIIYNPAENYHYNSPQFAQARGQVHDNAPTKKTYQYLAAKLLFLASCDAFSDAPFEASAIRDLQPCCQYVHFPQPIQMEDGSGSSMSTRIVTPAAYDQFLMQLGVVRILICMCSTGDVPSKMFRILLLKDPTGKQPSGCNVLFEGAVWKTSKSTIENNLSSSTSSADLRSPLPPMTPGTPRGLRSSAGGASIGSGKQRMQTSIAVQSRMDAYLTNWEMDESQPVCLVHSLNAIYTYYSLIGRGNPLATVVANIENNGNVGGGFDGQGESSLFDGSGGDNGGSSKNVSRKKSSLLLVKNKAAMMNGHGFNVRPLVVSLFLLQKAPDDEKSDQWLYLFKFELKKINPNDTNNSNVVGKVDLFQSSPYIRQLLQTINTATKPRGRGSGMTAGQRAAARRKAKNANNGYDSDDSCGSVGSPVMYTDDSGMFGGGGGSTFGSYDKVPVITSDNVDNGSTSAPSYEQGGFGYGGFGGGGGGGVEFPYGFDDGTADFDDAAGAGPSSAIPSNGGVGGGGFWDNSVYNQDSNGFLNAAAALFTNGSNADQSSDARFEQNLLLELMNSADNDDSLLWDAIGVSNEHEPVSAPAPIPMAAAPVPEPVADNTAAALPEVTSQPEKQYVSLYHSLDGYLDGLCNAMHKFNLQQQLQPSLEFEKHVDYAIVAPDEDEEDEDEDEDMLEEEEDEEEVVKEVLERVIPLIRERQQELDDEEEEEEEEEQEQDSGPHVCTYAKQNRLRAPLNVFCESLEEDVMRKYVYRPREHSYVLSDMGSGLIDGEIKELRWVLFDKCLFRQCAELKAHVPADLQDLCDEASAETCFFLLPVLPRQGLIYFHPDFVCHMADGPVADTGKHDGAVAVVEERVTVQNREMQRVIQLREQQQQAIAINNNNRKRPTELNAAAGGGEDGNFIHVFKMTQGMRDMSMEASTPAASFGAPAAQYASGSSSLHLPFMQHQQQQQLPQADQLQQQQQQQQSLVLEHPNYRVVYPFSQPTALLLRDMSMQAEQQQQQKQQQEEALRLQRQELEDLMRREREESQAELEKHRREMDELKTELRETVNTLKQFVGYANNMTSNNTNLELLVSQQRIASQAMGNEIKELRADLTKLLDLYRQHQQQPANAIVNEVLQQLGRRESQTIDQNIANQLHRLGATNSSATSSSSSSAPALPGSKIAAAAAHMKSVAAMPRAGYAGPMQSSMSSSMTGSSSSSGVAALTRKPAHTTKI